MTGTTRAAKSAVKKKAAKQPEEAPEDAASEATLSESETLELMDALAQYYKQRIVGRILAERRRKAGDPSASPRDYACMCPVSAADDLPICCGYADHCRFGHRARPRGPIYPNDTVRHALFRREYRGFFDRLERGEISSEEAARVFTQALRWRDRNRRREAAAAAVAGHDRTA